VPLKSNGKIGFLDPRLIALGLLALACMTSSIASDGSREQLAKLNALAKHFSKARSYALGSRPHPPHVDINSLIGLSSASILKALGTPDVPPTDDYDYDCGPPRCWAYSYGPSSSEFDANNAAASARGDLESIVVTTGGPYLLILGIVSDRVVTARWRGQK
jgi:hypothetical protein